MNKQQHKQLIEMLKELHLPMFREYHQEFDRAAIADRRENILAFGKPGSKKKQRGVMSGILPTWGHPPRKH